MAAPQGVEVNGPFHERYEEILTPAALSFLATLQREFGARRQELLANRAERQRELSRGGMLDFLPETAAIRADETWRVAPPAPGLEDRRVENPRPPDRK